MEQLLDPKVIAFGLAVALPAKNAADYVKGNVDDLPSYAPPVIAFIFAFALLMFVGLANGTELTAKFSAEMLLAAGYAAGGALFTTEYHNAVREAKFKKRIVKKEDPA